MRKALFVTMAATVFASLGCGPSVGNGPTSCNQNAACGGDIVGTWAIAELCNVVPTSGSGGFCPERQVSLPAFHETGTITFGTDGTQTSNVRATGTIKEGLPSTCLVAPLTCEAIDASIKEELAEPDSTYTSGGCTSSGGNCECTFSFDVTSTTSQTNTTSGSTLTVTRDDGTSTSASYCVQGSTLIISLPSTTGGPPGISVLTKQ
jgi:hypothetical protein